VSSRGRGACLLAAPRRPHPALLAPAAWCLALLLLGSSLRGCRGGGLAAGLGMGRRRGQLSREGARWVALQLLLLLLLLLLDCTARRWGVRRCRCSRRRRQAALLEQRGADGQALGACRCSCSCRGHGPCSRRLCRGCACRCCGYLCRLVRQQRHGCQEGRRRGARLRPANERGGLDKEAWALRRGSCW
jgi:hypothetical protein